METGAHAITSLLQEGLRNRDAENRLAAMLDDRLRRIARKFLSNGRRSPLWETTGLADEISLELLRSRKRDWKDREEFFAAATQMMRRRLIDYARRDFLSLKRGAGLTAQSLDPESAATTLASMLQFRNAESLIAVNELWELLQEQDIDAAHVFELHYFGLYSLKEISTDILQVPYDTVKSRWQQAKMTLVELLTRGGHEHP